MNNAERRLNNNSAFYNKMTYVIVSKKCFLELLAFVLKYYYGLKNGKIC